MSKAFLTICILLTTNLVLSQPSKSGRGVNYDSASRFFSEIFKKNNLSIEVQTFVLPKANIHTQEGNYYLNSKLMPSFGIGLNYVINQNGAWSICTGIHFRLIESNLYKSIPNNDLMSAGLPPYDNRPPLIYDKNAFTKILIPIIVLRRFGFNKSSFWDIQSGININYSGLSGDLGIEISVSDTNNRQVPIFNAEFKSNNSQKPWVSFILGISKNLILKNKNFVTITFLGEMSRTNFLKADYEITIPNQPLSRGTYKVTGSGLGLSVAYTFTGYNKRAVKKYERERKQ